MRSKMGCCIQTPRGTNAPVARASAFAMRKIRGLGRPSSHATCCRDAEICALGIYTASEKDVLTRQLAGVFVRICTQAPTPVDTWTPRFFSQTDAGSVSSIAGRSPFIHRSEGRSYGKHLTYTRSDKVSAASLALLQTSAPAFAQYTIGATRLDGV